MTIITEFGKFVYNHLLMRLCASENIFQSKLYIIIGDINGIKTHIEDILVLIREKLSKHIYQIRVIFPRLHSVVLKVNAPKCSFGLKGFIYLGYLITGEGIKPDLNKLQEIVDLGRTETINEEKYIIGLFQYYRDICPSQSHI